MENVPPPPGLGWPARGTKRTHNQMSGREPATSSPPPPAPPARRTRSPSPATLTDASSSPPTQSGSSSEHSTPQSRARRVYLFEDQRPSSLRLPSIRELDASTIRVDMEQPMREFMGSHRPRTQPAVIDLTADDEEQQHQQPPRAVPHPTINLAAADEDYERMIRPFGFARRGPRFPAEIIDLSGDTPRGPPRPQPVHDVDARTHANEDAAQGRPPPPSSSPEITFVRARAISPRLLHIGVTPPPSRAPNRLHHSGHIAPIEIPDDEDDIMIVRERIVPDPPTGRLNRLLANIDTNMRMLTAGHIPPLIRGVRAAEAGARHHRRRGAGAAEGRHFAFVAPVMDFGQAAFDLGYPPGMMEGATPEREREPSPVPVLPPAPEGFTRNPAEEDVLVCPACEAELGVGGEEAKRQVWMVKKCGHVYCGECAASRLQRAHKKGKEPRDVLPPLKKCAVGGCEAKTTGRQMVQLFL